MKKVVQVLFILSALALSGCSMLNKPDLEVRAINSMQAATWAEANKNDANSRLYIIHSDNMKGVTKWLVGLGVDVSLIK